MTSAACSCGRQHLTMRILGGPLREVAGHAPPPTTESQAAVEISAVQLAEDMGPSGSAILRME
jgi:hypothetical protein